MRILRDVCRIAGVIAAAGLVSAAVAGPGTGTTPTQPGKPIERPIMEPGKGERGAPANDQCSGAITVAANGTFIADLTGGTETGDVGYSCHNGGVGTLGFANIWYKFVATSTTMRIQTCNTTAVGDSLIALYDVDESDPCNTLVEIGCDDDSCGFTAFLSVIEALNLVVGQTYYIQIGAWTLSDIGPYTVQMQSPIPAITIPCPPGAQQENETDCLTLNPGCAGQGGGPNPALNTPITLPATVCGTGRLTSITPLDRDNDYYSFSIPTESSITVTIQGEFNIQAAIINTGGTINCPNPFAFYNSIAPVAGVLGTFTTCLPAGDWLLLVRSAGTGATFTCDQGLKYVLTVTDNGDCEDCQLTPPKGAQFENELADSGQCGGAFPVGGIDFYNGGCNSVPPVFSPVECGDTIYGTTASTGGSRDTDWYEIAFTEETEVTWSGTSENYELVVGIIDLTGPGTCPAAPAFRVAAVGAQCGTASVTTTLPAGSYAFFAAPDFQPAVACPGAESNPNYRVTLTCGGGPITDCNENKIDDAAEIAADPTLDCFDAAAPTASPTSASASPTGTATAPSIPPTSPTSSTPTSRTRPAARSTATSTATASRTRPTSPTSSTPGSRPAPASSPSPAAPSDARLNTIYRS